VSSFPKTLLLLMTFSVFFALLQLLLKYEGKMRTDISLTNVKQYNKETIRKENEAIPQFLKRYQSQSFDLWEKSFPKNKFKIENHEPTKSTKK